MEENDLYLDDPNWDVDSHDRQKAFWAHIGALIGLLIIPLNLVIPLIIHAKNKNKSTFVRSHAAAAFNFQIAVLLLLAIGYGVLNLYLVLGILTIVVAIGMHVYATISAALDAKDGQSHNYPIDIIRLLK